MRSLTALLLLCLFLPAAASAQNDSPQSAAPDGPTFIGFASGIYVVPDIGAATEWYTKALGTSPYFEESYYVGFRIGDAELGLVPAEDGSAAGPGGSLSYWAVADADAAVARLLAAGAVAGDPVTDVGGGVLVASVSDPYGNVLGIIEMPPQGN